MTDLERAVRRAALIAKTAHIHRTRRLRRPILRWCRT